MPEPQRQRLRELAAKAHARGRRLRFWGAPDNVAVWTEQLDAGVDFVGADDLAALQRFLLERAARR